jgi:predicted MFS family arabinose efflux permease
MVHLRCRPANARALFAVGILPALLVLWIRRSIPESEAFQEQRDSSAQPGIAHLLSAFRGPYLWLTIKVSALSTIGFSIDG